MEQYGTEQYNVERVLRENINGHEYMRRTAREMSTWEEIVDEMYRAVEHVEPWMSGNIRGPSSAFCLLYRLFELKLTEEQIQETITCKDSVHIRAIGFLYLRYVCQPHDLQSWFEPHLHDRTMFWPSGEGIGKRVTIGAFVTDLVLCQNYFETIFTRLPKKIVDDVAAYLTEQGLPCEALGNGGQGGPDRRGGDDGRARPASVKASLSVAIGQRAPNRAGVTEDVSTRYSRREDMAPRGPPPEDGRGSRPGSSHREHADRAPYRGDGHAAERRDPRARDDRPDERERDRRFGGSGRGGAYERDRERDRGGPPRSYGQPQRRDGERQWGRGDGGRDWQRDWRGDRRAPGASEGGGRHSSATGVFGRSAADVFGKSAAPSMPAAMADASDTPAPATGSAAVRIGRPRR